MVLMRRTVAGTELPVQSSRSDSRPKPCLHVVVDPRRLLLLRDVARAGSLSAAARGLGLTQPAVAQQVRALEAEAGTALVVRAGRGVALTEAGRVLVGHADAVADRLAAAEQELGALSGLAGGTVRLAAFPTAAAVLLPDALVALRERAPGLQVRFEELQPPEAEAAVRGADVDLAVVFRHERDREDVPGDLLRLPLLTHPVVVVVPRGAPAVRSLAELSGAAWVGGCPRCRVHLLRCAAAAGFVPDVRHATDDHVLVQRLVARGLGVALLPRWAVGLASSTGVQALEVPEVDGLVVEVLLRPDSRRVPGVAAALTALTEVARGVV